jgi:hypothetical protein
MIFFPFQAPDQGGKITFYFYPQTGSSFSLDTSANPSVGMGLDSSGVLKAGGTYTVLLSDLLAAAGASSDFTGYIIADMPFTNGHGQYFISDFAYFTNGALALVMGSTRGAPENLNQ